jgi:hypothetical protein
MPASHDRRLSLPSGSSAMHDEVVDFAWYDEVVDFARHDDVVDHWRSELALAEEAERDGGQRPWLARMRVRLYRFLVACYAAGPWGARPQDADDAGPEADSVAELRPDCPQPYISPAGWAHVRAPGKIAAVLKAVAGAQEPHVAGPLVHGIEPDSWVTLAAESSHVDLLRLAGILKDRGIERRIRKLGDDSILEVRACDRARAALGLRSAAVRTKFHRPKSSVRIFEILAVGVLLGLIGFPIMALLLPLLSWWMLGRPPGAEAWRSIQATAIVVGIVLAMGLSAWFTIRTARWRDALLFDRPLKVLRGGK